MDHFDAQPEAAGNRSWAMQISPDDVRSTQGPQEISLARSAHPVSETTTISVLLIDRHQLLREALARLLERVGSLAVVGDVLPDGEMPARVRTLQPDVILFGIHSEHENAVKRMIDLLRIPQQSKTIVVLTFHPSPGFTRRLLDRVDGIIGSDSTFQDVLNAIRRVKAGGCYIAPEVAHHLVARMRGALVPLGKLSGRELEVAAMTIDGFRPQEIADRMAVSRRTIGTMRHRIFKKLQIRTDADLVRLSWNPSD